MLVLSELRPNNLYMVKKSILVALEDHLNDGTSFLLYFHGMPSGIDFKEVRPIPLNDGWLKQLGLVKRYGKGEWSWANCKHTGEWASYTELHNDGGKYYYMKDYPPIEYVHQLQNLYNSLTREELQYKADLLKPSKELARIQHLEDGLLTVADSIQSLVTEAQNIPGREGQNILARLRVLPGVIREMIDQKI